MNSALGPMLVCIAAVLVLLALLRRDRESLGLPMAYMLALMLIHLPGAYASVASGGIYGEHATPLGAGLTAIGAISFVAGVWLARRWVAGRAARARAAAPAARHKTPRRYVPQNPGPTFRMFCLLGGWVTIYGVALLLRIPSISAVVDKGGAIWMLGAVLGMANAFVRKDIWQMMFWGGAALVYPLLVLVIGGFASYGSTALLIVLAVLTVVARTYWRTVVALSLGAFVSISAFVNYFAARGDLRRAAWSGASLDERLAPLGRAIRDFAWFSVENPAHLDALDKRLNQNYFVGVTMERIQLGQVDFLYGRSVWEGALALIPRLLWPDKPIFGGSGNIVREMTGLKLNYDTSWGVGNVMEFYINLGLPGLILGFLILGALIGGLDRKAAEALRVGDLGSAFVFFLPCVALIQPNGSIVELSSAAAAALVAGFFWRWAWRAWSPWNSERAPTTNFAQPRP